MVPMRGPRLQATKRVPASPTLVRRVPESYHSWGLHLGAWGLHLGALLGGGILKESFFFESPPKNFLGGFMIRFFVESISSRMFCLQIGLKPLTEEQVTDVPCILKKLSLMIKP